MIPAGWSPPDSARVHYKVLAYPSYYVCFHLRTRNLGDSDGFVAGSQRMLAKAIKAGAKRRTF